MNQDLLYWIIGVIGLLIIVLGFFFFYRSRTRGKELQTPFAQPLPPPPEEPLITGGERVTSTRGDLQLEPVPSPRGEIAPPLGEAVPRGVEEPGDLRGDLPSDLAAREGGSLPEQPLIPPHTIEEIQRAEPQPLQTALANTRTSFFGRIKSLFSTRETLTADEIEQVEEILYTSDLGPATVQRLLSAVESRINTLGGSGLEGIREALRLEMMDIFDSNEAQRAIGNGHAKANSATDGEDDGPIAKGHLHLVTAADEIHPGSASYLDGLDHLNVWDHKPAVLLIVGVNGAGKTTTIGKLSRRFIQSGRRVLVAAGDTFRAAAGDQLKVWADRAQVEIFSPPGVTDPSAVAFDACQSAKSKGFDIVIIDTAGRLHTQKNLMEELKKMRRVIEKVIPDAPHEVLLVLDANSGQNALVQAREFSSALDVTGVVLTKMDGTAKGGVAVGLACELGLPIKLIGVGEKIEDLRKFSPTEFVNSII